MARGLLSYRVLDGPGAMRRIAAADDSASSAFGAAPGHPQFVLGLWTNHRAAGIVSSDVTNLPVDTLRTRAHPERCRANLGEIAQEMLTRGSGVAFPLLRGRNRCRPLLLALGPLSIQLIVQPNPW